MSQVPAKRNRSKKIFKSRAEVNRAAQMAGIPVVDLAKYKGASMVGKIIQECDVLCIGLSMYAFTKPKLEAVMQKCDDLLSALEVPEDVALIGNLQRTVAIAYNDLATSIISSVASSHQGSPGKPRAVFPPGAVVQAVIVNEKSKDDPKPIHNV